MLVNVPAKFPAEELENSLENLQSILDAVKPLAVELVLDDKVKEAVLNCIKALQTLLSKKNGWQDNEEEKSMIQLRIRQLKQKGHLTQEEQEELKQLLSQL